MSTIEKNRTWFGGLVITLCFATLSGCSEPKNQLQQIRERGELRIVTRNGPTTYYFERDVETGLEFELVKRYADFLDLPLKIILAKNTAEIIEKINNNEADIAAAALAQSEELQRLLAFGPNYHWITQNVVYRNGRRRPRSLDDIHPYQLHFADGALQAAELDKLKQKHPDLSWITHDDMDTQELLEMIESKEILYTLADSNELAISRIYFPEIRAAFMLDTEPKPLAWAYRRKNDQSLRVTINDFFQQMEQEGSITSLIEYFFGPSEHFDYVDSRKFVDRFNKRLPQYRDLFEKAAKEHGLDWRLLASLGYQESHWNEKAISPTGVRGMMMLTQNTARSVGVTNRLDPAQSIAGGTAYLKSLISRVPERLQEPDRTWFALAAYNVGLGHLEDARKITQKQGSDPYSR